MRDLMALDRSMSQYNELRDWITNVTRLIGRINEQGIIDESGRNALRLLRVIAIKRGYVSPDIVWDPTPLWPGAEELL